MLGAIAAVPALPYVVAGAAVAAAVGYQGVRIDQPDDGMRPNISDARWRRLTAGISRARYYWGGRPLVDALFRNFLNAGYGYNLGNGLVIELVGTQLGAAAPEGNCFAYSKTFARLLNSVGIEARSEEVRSNEQGRFIVRVDRFIDPRVRGHIHYRGRLVPHYYMFNSHVAVWVPSLRTYYDPMACTTYADFNSNQITEVDGPDDRHLRTRRAPPFAAGIVNLEITNTPEDGGFRRVIATDA